MPSWRRSRTDPSSDRRQEVQELKARVEELQEQIRQLQAEVEATRGEYREFRRLVRSRSPRRFLKRNQ